MLFLLLDSGSLWIETTGLLKTLQDFKIVNVLVVLDLDPICPKGKLCRVVLLIQGNNKD